MSLQGQFLCLSANLESLDLSESRDPLDSMLALNLLLFQLKFV